MKKLIQNKIRPNLKRGFTLVETLVAISVLSIAILGTFTAVQQGLQSSIFVQDQITAFYLTQETMEFIRNIRDENAIKSINSISNGGPAISWLTGLSVDPTGDPCCFGKICRIDSPLKTINYCGASWGNCPNLNQDTGSSLFGYTSGWPQTGFKREIQLENVSDGREIAVIVSINWGSGIFSRSFQVRQSLFNNR